MKKSFQRKFFRWLLAHLLAPPPSTKKRRKRMRPAGPPPDFQVLDRSIIPDEVSVRLSPDPPPLNFHAVEGNTENSFSKLSNQSSPSATLKKLVANDDTLGQKGFLIRPIKAHVRYGYWGYSALGQQSRNLEDEGPGPQGGGRG
jgi:hypothetical protein